MFFRSISGEMYHIQQKRLHLPMQPLNDSVGMLLPAASHLHFLDLYAFRKSEH